MGRAFEHALAMGGQDLSGGNKFLLEEAISALSLGGVAGRLGNVRGGLPRKIPGNFEQAVVEPFIAELGLAKFMFGLLIGVLESIGNFPLAGGKLSSKVRDNGYK